VTIDHGLQPESAEVADRAVAACRDLGLAPVWREEVVVAGPGGREAAARDARYRALDEAAAATGAVCVLLGHTLDDQAETVLLALARGSGARSLAGMPAVRGPYRRPFLHLRRVQTDAVCVALGLQPWTDPTNADPGANRRAAVRHDVVPALEHALGPAVVPALARTADLLRADADLLENLAGELLEASAHERSPGQVVLDVDVLAGGHPALMTRALRTAALSAGCPAGSLGAAHMEAMVDLITNWHGQGPVHLPGRVVAHRSCGRLTLQTAGASGEAGGAR
jgi:tRNA(Ile)-lysidine synthase